MATAYIHEAAGKLLQKCQSRDPFEIAKSTGIKLRYYADFTLLKGMYIIIERNRYIFLNSNLNRNVQRVVCAHELGHDSLHRAFAKDNALKEFMLYDMSTRPEYEANVFAAEILLDDEEVFALVKGGYDLPQIAAKLNTDYNLLSIKMNEMAKKGYDLRISFDIDTRFLGKSHHSEFEMLD